MKTLTKEQILFNNGIYLTDLISSSTMGGIEAAMEEYYNQDKWIRVEDAKPDKGKPVLLFNGHWIGVGFYKKNFALNIDGEPEWSDETSEYIHPNPTHWQPLPNSPKQ
jgi:hypothetical protein